jgi:nitrate/nitrite-specific signal transduction histidine kinase
MTLSIIALVLLSQFLIKQSLTSIKTDAAIKNIAGEQRMLSQQMVKEIATDNLAGVIVGEPVDKLVKDFSYKHQALLKGDSRLNLRPLDEKFLRDYNTMDAAYKNFIKSLEQTIARENNNNDFVDVMNKQESFLKQMDAFAYAVDGYSDIKARKFQLNEILITMGSLVIILLEVLFIFLPAINKIKKQNEQLKTIAYTQSHIVRQPVANLKGLLFLMNDNKLDNEVKQLVELATSEAEKIDTIIKNTVYATQD